MMLETLDPVVLGRMFARAHDAARRRLVERLDQEGRLAAARNAGDGGEDAERDLGRDVLQIVAARADDLDLACPSSACGARPAPRPPSSPDRYWPVSEFGLAMISARRALGDDLAAMDAGGRADIDDIIGRQDRVLVMLDDDHRIADIAQVLQRIEQAGIVALVQADRRLVEHVEHAGQAGADLRGKPDALALAARQRAGIARQRQIIEPDIVEEAQPLADFLEDAHGDLVLLGGQLAPAVARTSRRAMRIDISRDLADVQAVDLDRQRFRLQAIAVAGRAGGRRHVALDLLARPGAVGLLPAALEIGDDALEGLCRLVGARAVVIVELDLVVGAVQDRLLRRLGQFGPAVWPA